MKKLFNHLAKLAMIILLLPSLTGCGNVTSEINPQTILQTLLTQVQYETELSEVGSNASLYFPDLPENATIQFHTGSGYYADRVALLTFSNPSDCKDAITVVKNHVEELKNQFSNYVPEEVQKIDHAVIYQNGQFLFLCITNDYANVNSLLNNYTTR